MRTLMPLTVPGWGHVCADAGAAPAARAQAAATDARTADRMPGFLASSDEDRKVGPDVLGGRLEARLPKPRELLRTVLGRSSTQSISIAASSGRSGTTTSPSTNVSETRAIRLNRSRLPSPS